MKPIEGQISIDIYPHKIMDTVVEIVSSRPLQASKILISKTPRQALSVIPLMYNICGTAHSRAALKSIQQCLQIELDPEMEMARDMLLMVEIAKEHLLRIFLDWPKLFDIDAGKPKLAFISQLSADFKSALFFQGRAFALDSKADVQSSSIKKLIEGLQQYLYQHVFSSSPVDWLTDKNTADILQWSEQTDTSAAQAIHRIFKNGWASQGPTDCQQLPVLDSRQLFARFAQDDADQFIARPTWQGRCFETTALSRQLEYPLVQLFHQEFQGALITRWMARLVELARIPQQLTTMLDQMNEQNFNQLAEQTMDRGVTQVETARGRLIHRVEMGQGVISNYQILAPTEWNFHPQGVLAQSLASLKTNEQTELRQLAHLMINAIDPCVGYELRTH